LKKFLPKKVFVWPAFTSMTSNKDVAMGFGNVVFEIRCNPPKGTYSDNIAEYAPASVSKWSNFPSEDEILFPPNAQFQVVEVQKNSDGVALVICETIGLDTDEGIQQLKPSNTSSTAPLAAQRQPQLITMPSSSGAQVRPMPPLNRPVPPPSRPMPSPSRPMLQPVENFAEPAARAGSAEARSYVEQVLAGHSAYTMELVKCVLKIHGKGPDGLDIPSLRISLEAESSPVKRNGRIRVWLHSNLEKVVATWSELRFPCPSTPPRKAWA